MADHSNMRLGKHPQRVDSRTLMMTKYVKAGLALPPEVVVNSRGQTSGWGMLKNDELGDCTIAACLHAIQTWVVSEVYPGIPAQLIQPSDDIAVRYYSEFCGYVRGDESTDRGGVEIDVLNRWRKAGIAGYNILAYAAIDPQDTTNLRQAVNLFGGVYVGIQLPISAQNQDVWDVVSGPRGERGSWGGHAVFIVDYTPDLWTCITWGGTKSMTPRFVDKHLDEAYAIVSPEWSKEGIATDMLLADLQVVSR